MAQRLTGQLLHRRLDGRWEYTLAEAAREGGGVLVDGNLYSAKIEYGCSVYCDTTASGPLRDGEEEAGGHGW